MRFFTLFGAGLFALATALPAAQEIPSIPDTSDVTSLISTDGLVPDTSDLARRQQHPAGPGRAALIKLLGKDLYHEISSAVHAVGISVAHTEQEINQIVTALSPSLGADLHKLLTVVDTLEADLVSIGFNT